MSSFDLIIRNSPDLGITDGIFTAVASDLRGSAKREIDATGLLVFPGVLDAHVHFNEPGRTEWEGLATGSRAAAAGGTTTFFDMPLNAFPPTVDASSFDQKRAAAEARSVLDFALWGGIVPWSLDQIEALHARGVIGLKAFLSKCGTEGFPNDFSNVSVPVLEEGMKRAAALGMIVAVHAEFDRPELISGFTARDYCRSRPLVSEMDAIRCVLDLSLRTGCSVHIVHVSSGSAVALIAEARTAGVDVTCETCPHYLLMTEDDMERLGGIAKCAPPLRPAAELANLHAEVRRGHVQTIGSDHSPAPPEMREGSDFFKIWGGIAGCQHLLTLMLDTEFPPKLLQEMLCSNVADRFRIAPQKGKIAVGGDADCVIVNPNVQGSIGAGDLHYRHRQSPYVGRKTSWRVEQTLLRGRPVFEAGKFAGETHGRLLRPQSVI